MPIIIGVFSANLVIQVCHLEIHTKFSKTDFTHLYYNIFKTLLHKKIFEKATRTKITMLLRFVFVCYTGYMDTE